MISKVIGILQQAKKNGVHISLVNGALQVGVSKGKVIEPNLLSQIKEFKSDITAFLNNDQLKSKKTTAADNEIKPVNRDEYDCIPLSFSQERLLFIDQLEGSVQYHLSAILRINGPLNLVALQQAFTHVIARHEVLRTVMVLQKDTYCQKILPAQDFKLNIHDLAAGPDAQPADQWAKQWIDAPFNLFSDLMLRVHVGLISDMEAMLVVTVHHIAADGWSISIIMKNVADHYNAILQNKKPEAEAAPIGFADFAIWQRSHLSGQVLKDKLDYWIRKLDGLAPLQLPADHSRPGIQSTRGAIANFSIEAGTSKAIADLARSNNSTLFVTLLGAFNILLHRYSGQQDICVGTPVAGRHKDELDEMVGFFANTIALRNTVDAGQSFSSWIQQVNTSVYNDFEQQDVPFEKVVEKVVRERDLSRSPIFQIMFGLQNTPGLQHVGLGDAVVTLEPLPFTASRYDITFNVKESAAGLQVMVEYCTDLYEAETIARMFGHYQTLLSSIVTNPDQQIGQLSMLPDHEQELLLEQFNNTSVQLPALNTLTERFKQQALSTPDQVAVVYEAESLSYKELDHRSSQLANFLIQHGVKPGSMVPLCIERGLNMVVGLLGILKTGSAFVPVDPEFPADRIQFMIEDSAAPIIVTSSLSRKRLPVVQNVNIIEIDVEASTIFTGQHSDPAVLINPEHLAYIIHTSGSTGKPKGVMIEHQSVINLIDSIAKIIEFTSSSSFLSVTTYSFDICYLEFFMPLISGGKLIVVARDITTDGFQLARSINQYAPTHMQATPSTWQMLVNSDWTNGEQVKMLIGGEAVSNDIKESLTTLGSVWNVYGPTETTIWSTIQPLSKQQKVVIGKPVANTKIYITNSQGNLAGIGLPGEICIAGIGLAKGYLNRPELTAEKFVPNPFADIAGERMYKTGDLGRWLSNGTIEYIQRIDDQVKVRGYRIELGEIENVIQQSGLVKQAVIAAKDDVGGNKRLVGYVVTNETFDRDELVTFLRSKLPEYMVPFVWVTLQNFPLTPNGKIDRKALPQVQQQAVATRQYVAPRTETEQQVADIWKTFLGIDNPGVHDNFFELGGHSLLAMQIITAMRRQMRIEVSLKELFVHPTIEALANAIESRTSQSLQSSIQVGERGNSIPLSYSQERLWFIDKLEGTQPYHLPAVLRLRGEMNQAALEQAFNAVIQRHEILRTVYAEHEGEPYQVILEDYSFQLENTVLIGEPPTLQTQLINEVLTRPFDLSKEGSVRAHLLQIDANEHLLVIVLHHIAADGWSIQLFVHEVSALYEHFTLGTDHNLPLLPVQYADYAIWQRKHLSGDILQNKLAYWSQRLSDLEPLQVPTDFPRPAVQSSKGNIEKMLLPAALTAQVKSLNKQYGITTFVTMLTTLKMLLHRYTDQPDVCVGTPVANRNQPDIENLVGFFINTLALRTEVTSEDTFDGLLQKVSSTVVEAFDYQDVPFEKVVEAVVKKRDLSRTPLFQVLFVMRTESSAPAATLHGLQMGIENLEQSTAMFDLTFYVTETAGGIQLAMEYRTDLFLPVTIKKLLGHFVQLFAAACSEPKNIIGKLSMVSAEEEHRLLREFNQTTTPYPEHKRIEHFFEEQVEIHPDTIAVVYNNEQLTYRQLNDKANRLAQFLRSKGVTQNSLVPVFLERGMHMIVSVFAILKAGGAYVPVDPEYPEERISFMLSEIDAPFILSSQLSKPLLANVTGTEIVDLDNDPTIDGFAAQVPDKHFTPDDIGYILYTSGSTGRPKGARMPVNALVNLLHWQQQQFGEGPRNVIQFSSLNFDVSYLEIFCTLGHGGTLYLIDGERRKDVVELVSDMLRFNITHQYTPYVVLKTLAEHLGDRAAELTHLRHIVVSGEQLKINTEITNFLQKSGVLLTNQYGPTEGHVVSAFTMHPHDDVAVLPPIGKPINNTQLYILNKYFKPVPVGVNGDLYIGGVPSGSTYLMQPALTAEKFFNDPFAGTPNALLYKTGDLARWLPDGNIDFLGRRDDQVKIRGFRIELGEIESLLQQFEEVEQVAVIAGNDNNGTKRLIAYVVPRNKFDREALINFLKKKVPDYMVPSLWIELQTMPVNKSGKIDKRSLPAVDVSSISGYTYEAPRTEVEKTLAGIWQVLLKNDRIGINDNFFEAGGHSLLATRVVSAIKSQLQVSLGVRDLFIHSTIAELARCIQDREINTEASLIGKIERPALLPLSFSQERIWFVDQLSGSTQYHLPSVIQLSGKLNVQALKQAFESVVIKHEVLRTVFLVHEGLPYQQILPPETWNWTVVEDAAATTDIVHRDQLIRDIVQKPFDLAKDLLLRVVLLKLAHEKHVLIIVVHHILADGWSMPILVQEVTGAYNSWAPDAALMAPLDFQYADYAVWQRNYMQGAVLQNQLAYWQQKLMGVETLQLPHDFSRPPIQSTVGATIDFKIDNALKQQLLQFGLRHECTLFMTILSALNVLLYKYSGQSDIVVGTPVANRTIKEIEGLVGNFINLLALRNNVQPIESFAALTQQVKETTLEAYDNQQVPFEKVIDAVGLERDLSRSPIFQVLLVLQNFDDSENVTLNNLNIDWLHNDHRSTKFDLTLFVKESSEGIRFTLEYASVLFLPSTMNRMAEHFTQLLSALIEAPAKPIHAITYLGSTEQKMLLEAFQPPAVTYHFDHMLSLFEGQAISQPGNIAVIEKEQQITYGQLNEQANRVAHYLLQAGISKEELVPVYVERSINLLVAMLGILKAGAAYVPVDTIYPEERVSFMIEDSGAKVVICSDETRPLISTPTGVTLLNIDDENNFSSQPINNPDVAIAPNQLAYVMYTSGSTGKPKGVMIEHRNVCAFLGWCKDEFSATPADIIYAGTSVCFDLSVFEIFFTLSVGKQIRLLQNGLEASVYIKDDRNILLNSVPSVIESLLRQEVSLENVVAINMAGEPVATYVQTHLDQENIEVRNLYGPTEDTTYSTIYRMGRQKPLLIGKPITNTQILILDDQLSLVPVGVPGEICIAGNGLARGYLNKEALTAEKFVRHPYKQGDRLYRTGDIGRWLENGNIEYIGRKDGQVKIRGYRIELGEIESVLQQQSMIGNAAVLATPAQDGPRKLVAYIVANASYNKQELIEELGGRLPAYMIPQDWVLLESLPLTSNGKVDRKALAAIPTQDVEPTDYVAPDNQVAIDMATIWSELLGKKQVGIHDNFFELGGDSIMGIQVVSRANRKGYKLQPRDIFQHQTIDRLSKAMMQAAAVHSNAEQGVLSGAVGLLPIQQLFLSGNSPALSHYNQSVMLSVSSAINQEHLTQVVKHLMQQHDALRMKYRQTNGSWQQEYGDAEGKLYVENISSVEDSQRAIEAITERYQQDLNIEAGDLLRVVWIQMPELAKHTKDGSQLAINNGTEYITSGDNQINDNATSNRLLIIIHHLAVDGVSWRVLLQDVEMILDSVLKEETIVLPPKTNSYRQWYGSLEQYGNSRRCKDQLGWWQKVYSGYDRLATDMQWGGPLYMKDLKHLQVTLDAEHTGKLLNDIPRVYHTGINDMLLTALSRTFAADHHTNTLVIGLEGHGREDIDPTSDISHTTGWFTTLYPVRISSEGAGNDDQLLKKVKEQLRNVPDRGIGYGVLKYIAKEPSLQGKEEYDLLFNYLGQLDNVVNASKWFSGAPESAGVAQSEDMELHEKITLISFVANGQLIVKWSFSAKHFHRTTIEHLADRYIKNLMELIDHCMLMLQQGNAVFTPSDFGLGADVSVDELDKFLEEEDNILSF